MTPKRKRSFDSSTSLSSSEEETEETQNNSTQLSFRSTEQQQPPPLSSSSGKKNNNKPLLMRKIRVGESSSLSRKSNNSSSVQRKRRGTPIPLPNFETQQQQSKAKAKKEDDLVIDVQSLSSSSPSSSSSSSSPSPAALSASASSPECDEDGDMEVPYTQNLGLPGEAQGLPDLSRKKEPLKPGDLIMYNNPVFVAGSNQAKRFAFVLNTDPNREFPLVLDNGECLPSDTQVKRCKEYKRGRLLDHRGVYRPIDNFRMSKAALSERQAGELAGFQNTVDRLKDFMKGVKSDLERVPENLEAESSESSSDESSSSQPHAQKRAAVIKGRRNGRSKEESPPSSASSSPILQQLGNTRKHARTDNDTSVRFADPSNLFASSDEDSDDGLLKKPSGNSRRKSTRLHSSIPSVTAATSRTMTNRTNRTRLPYDGTKDKTAGTGSLSLSKRNVKERAEVTTSRSAGKGWFAARHSRPDTSPPASSAPRSDLRQRLSKPKKQAVASSPSDSSLGEGDMYPPNNSIDLTGDSSDDELLQRRMKSRKRTTNNKKPAKNEHRDKNTNEARKISKMPSRTEQPSVFRPSSLEEPLESIGCIDSSEDENQQFSRHQKMNLPTKDPPFSRDDRGYSSISSTFTSSQSSHEIVSSKKYKDRHCSSKKGFASSSRSGSAAMSASRPQLTFKAVSRQSYSYDREDDDNGLPDSAL